MTTTSEDISTTRTSQDVARQLFQRGLFLEDYDPQRAADLYTVALSYWPDYSEARKRRDALEGRADD